MEIFKSLASDEHEQVVFWSDKVAGLRSIIAIHDTTLGPAIGGVRMHPYKSEDEALRDVLLLSRSMTYKSAAAGINFPTHSVDGISGGNFSASRPKKRIIPACQVLVFKSKRPNPLAVLHSYTSRPVVL